MATVESSESAPKKKKGMLGDMSERLGIGAGSEMIAPRLRQAVQQMGPIGVPFAANIALEQRKAEGQTGSLMSNPSVTATAKMTGRTREQVISGLGR